MRSFSPIYEDGAGPIESHPIWVDPLAVPPPSTAELAWQISLSGQADAALVPSETSETMDDSSLPIALVTGATRGLGLAIAQDLARDHHVLLGGRDPEKTRDIATTLGNATPFIADLGDENEVKEAVSRVESHFGRINLLVHNAGLAHRGPIENTSRDIWRSLFEVNVFAVADLTRLMLPLLRRVNGHIVVINSGAGIRSYPSDAAYCASKWALRSFTDSVRESERGTLKVTALHPGRINTDMQRRLYEATGREYDPADHMAPEDVVRTLRLAISLPPCANVDELHIRTTEAH